ELRQLCRRGARHDHRVTERARGDPWPRLSAPYPPGHECRRRRPERHGALLPMRCMRCLGIGLLAWGWSSGAWAETAAMLGENQQVLVNLTGGLPERWTSCADSCTGGHGPRAAILDQEAGGSRLRWDVPGYPAATRALELLEYTAEVGDTGSDAVLTLTSRGSVQGTRLVHHYALSAAGYTLSASLQVPAGARLVLQSGEAFVPPPLPGPASMDRGVHVVRVRAPGPTVVGS